MADFVWPTDPKGRISSYYGKRKSQKKGMSSDHKGIDIAGCTYALAARAGTVILRGWNKFRGYYLDVDHGGGIMTRYQHFYRNGIFVKNGAQVVAGQRLARIGDNGEGVTGPHLHFEVLVKGVPVDPLRGYTYGTGAPSGPITPIDVPGTGQTPESEAAVAVIHIPQTEKVWTAYEGDTRADRKVDAYRVTWQAADGTIRDITERCSPLELVDDSASVCVELSFSVLNALDDTFQKPMRLEPGDHIAVTNTGSGEVIYVGQVQKVSGDWRTAISVQCLDAGRLLTSNQVIMQFNNFPAKQALSQIANKIGFSSIVVPELISSVYGIEKDSASGIAQKILETVTSENGVPYFIRVQGDCLTVRSFGKEPLDFWYRQEANLACLNVLDEISNISFGLDISDLRNKVIIYADQDGGVDFQAEEADADSVKRYGERVAIETFSDTATGTAADRAKTLLKARNVPTESVSLECYGSDRVMAGVRLKLDLPEATGEYWVTAVTHHLDTPHRMTLTLIRATEGGSEE